MKKRLLICILIVTSFLSCSHKKVPIAFYSTNESEDTTNTTYSDTVNGKSTNLNVTESANEVDVPFFEQNGVKLVDVTVNGQFTVKMILDSGCSSTLISIAEAKYLYDKGCFSSNDILGVTKSQIADGSIVEDMVINLKRIVIGGQISCSNVTATVSSNAQAPLLLGNDVLNRVPSYSVDNENQVIRFQLKE
jgi:predicted aspartyl protease